MLLALSATAIVIVALLWEVALPQLQESYERHKARRARVRWDDALGPYDPGRERRAEQRARQLLRSCVNEEEWAMYRDLGFLRVWGRLAEGPTQGGSDETEAGAPGGGANEPGAGAPSASLLPPQKPIVAYLPQTRTLLNEYCVAFPDET